MARRRGVCGEAVWLCGSTVSTAWRGDGGAPHSWSNCCCVLCINRSHFQSENNLVVVANCACPLLSIHSNLRINWWSTDQNYDLLRYGGKKFWELYFLVSVWLTSWLLFSISKIWDYDHVTFILFLFKSILESMAYVGYMWSKLKIFHVLIYVLCITGTDIC